MQYKKHLNPAFTLIELMVCIAVAALLLGVLLPALSQARQAGRSCVCRSRLSQWYVAVAAYASDNNGQIPRRGQGIQPLANVVRPQDWFNALPEYMGQETLCSRAVSGDPPQAGGKDLFICPSARQPQKHSWYFLPLVMNMYLSPWIRPAPHRMTEIRQPSELVFMTDGPGPYSAAVPSDKDYSVIDRHNNRANLVCLDGHVTGYPGQMLGCGVGEPVRGPVRWNTQTTGINQLFTNP